MTAVTQPSGEVTLVFTDIEGSTRLLEELGTQGYREALAEHRRIVREACSRYEGYEVDYEGDAFFYAFPSAQGAVSAVSEAIAGLEEGSIRIRVGIHTGTPEPDPPKYVGLDVHTAARIMSSGHGGQVVVSPTTAAVVGVSLRELGEHRLKDIEHAIPLYQLGEGSFPPLKTISNTNLPRPASSFVGREEELREVLSRIEEGARLLTFSGPGGSGKTRLALEAALTLVPSYKAGVFWVGLASLRDPTLVTETIAQTLGAKDSLAEHIAERELLLLLDNLEQVIEAAPELSQLLQSCPNLTLLVTSRELLRVQGEVEYAVPPLASPEAVSLFCERSQLEASDEISELCVRLDSLPLALELAAARTKALSVAQILERLSQRLDLLRGGRDADPRQQTLRATIEWSYELLSPEEQELFARLSVFAGGCTLEAAEEVCDADLDTLQSLVEKSLLRFTEGRYWMLETIREYASACLDHVGAHERFVDQFVRLAKGLPDEHASMTADAAIMEGLDAEISNLRAVLQWLLDRRDGKRLLEVTNALAPYWLARGHHREGLMWVEAALAFADDGVVRCRLLSAAADLAWTLGDLERARSYAVANLELADRLGEPRAIGQALHDLAEVVTEDGDFERAKELYEEAIRRAGEVGYPAPGSLGNLALIAFAERDYERSRELTLRAIDVFRTRNNQLGYATATLNLACVALYCGDFDEACASLRESIEICASLQYVALSPNCVEACAAVLAHMGRPTEAATLLGASQNLFDEIGARLETTEKQMHDETESLIRASLDEQVIAAAYRSGSELALDQALLLALACLD